ncbi:MULTISPECIES: hypothetical protein [unclassified Flavobacterium]|jgi:ABC-type Na+ efflux pump permease subunit|uniref:hypothetical protein n=2 Tax=Flavobacterium TaxID=237 RepID=UPI0025BB894B|nr:MULTISPECIES: hypothetical protein [unclassified Flavobacterium]
MEKTLHYLFALLLAVFGLLTLFLTTSILFDLFGVREQEGNYVLTVVWANFICSIIYLIASYGFIKKKEWTFLLLSLATIILISAFILFAVHIYYNGVYETKTVGAMGFRISLSIVFTAISFYYIKNKKTIK